MDNGLVVSTCIIFVLLFFLFQVSIQLKISYRVYSFLLWIYLTAVLFSLSLLALPVFFIYLCYNMLSVMCLFLVICFLPFHLFFLPTTMHMYLSGFHLCYYFMCNCSCKIMLQSLSFCGLRFLPQSLDYTLKVFLFLMKSIS